MDLNKYRDLFISEFEEHLEQLNTNLVEFEKNQTNTQLLTEIMRALHSIKGLTATMGYQSTSELAHIFEDLFDQIRTDPARLTPEIINLMYSTIDFLENSKTEIVEKNQEIDPTEKLTQLKTIINQTNATPNQPPSPTPSPVSNNPENNQIENKEQLTLNYIKVPVARLDNLLNLVEEIFVERIRLDELKSLSPTAKEIIDNLNKLITEIQYYTLQTRLVPVGQIFAKFPRMVRDLAVSLNKDINFTVLNDDIELDRTIIDQLSEPLIHLLRNAVDHGTGEKGDIFLRAEKRNEVVFIEVENSDKAIDYEKIRNKAIEKGLISQADAANLKEIDLQNFLFSSKLSTKDVVTNLSGRGVGLGIVKEFVKKVGGRVSIQSPLENENGIAKGTKITLELPTSLSIVKAMIATVKDNIFALPFFDIERTIRLQDADIKQVADSYVVIVEKNEIPILQNSFFGKIITEQSQNKNSKQQLIVLKSHNGKKAIIVDTILQEKEIVIKPFPETLKKEGSFSGVTILDKGKVALVIDAIYLLSEKT
ncbi:MAG: ATP-binding protein [bacterium]